MRSVSKLHLGSKLLQCFCKTSFYMVNHLTHMPVLDEAIAEHFWL